jgi:hypothetical protein
MPHPNDVWKSFACDSNSKELTPRWPWPAALLPSNRAELWARAEMVAFPWCLEFPTPVSVMGAFGIKALEKKGNRLLDSNATLTRAFKRPVQRLPGATR